MSELRPYTPRVTVVPRGRALAPRCCAKCKTPGFGCANAACACHSRPPLTGAANDSGHWRG